MAQNDVLDVLNKRIKESEKKIVKMYREALRKDDPLEIIGVVLTDMLAETILTTQEIARHINVSKTSASKNVSKLVKQDELIIVKSDKDHRSKRYTVK